jgi:hypothetical protein
MLSNPEFPSNLINAHPGSTAHDTLFYAMKSKTAGSDPGTLSCIGTFFEWVFLAGPCFFFSK